MSDTTTADSADLTLNDVEVRFRTLSWTATTTAEGSDAKHSTVLIANGWLVHGWWSSAPAIMVEEGVDLDQVPCSITICRRADAPVVEDVLGYVQFYPETSDISRQDAAIFGEVGIDADLHADLVWRHLNGNRLPEELRVWLSGIPVAVSSGRPRGALSATSETRISRLALSRPSRQPVTGAYSRCEGPPAPILDCLSCLDWDSQGWLLEHDQFRRVAGELMASAILAVRDGRIGWDDLGGSVCRGWTLAATLYEILLDAERTTRKARRNLTRHRKQKRVEASSYPTAFPWRKREPRSDLYDGQDSAIRCGIELGCLQDIASEYETSGLISPTMEWILVDAAVYAECREYGETIKQQAPGGILDVIVDDYGVTGGNANRMLLRRSLRQLPAALAKGSVSLLAWYVLPGLAIINNASNGDLGAAGAIAAGWVIAVALWPHFLRGLGVGVRHEARRKTISDQLALFGTMVGAYKGVLLTNPPEVVRQELNRASVKGAVWDGMVYRILLRAEQRDRASWFERTTEPGELARLIERFLEEAYRKRRAEHEIGRPDPDDAPFLR